MKEHPELSSEEEGIQSDVFFSMASALKSGNDFSATKLKKFMGKKIDLFSDNEIRISKRASSGGSTVPDDDPSEPVSGDLTWQDVGACALEAVGGAIAGSFKLFKQLHGVITGYNLGYSGIVNVATSAFRTVAGSSAPVMAITFGFCIAREVIFGDEEEIDSDDTDVDFDLPIDSIEWAGIGEE